MVLKGLFLLSILTFCVNTASASSSINEHNESTTSKQKYQSPSKVEIDNNISVIEKNVSLKDMPTKTTKFSEKSYLISWNNIASLGTLFSALATLVIAWFTYQAAKISSISANAAKKAADSAEKSIEVARESYTASERPWISVKAKISTDLVKKENGIDFGVIFNLKNHGLSPARNVHVHYKVVTLKVEQDQFSGARESIYELGRSGSGSNMGIQLFPSESNTISWQSPLTNDEIQAARTTASPSSNLPAFYIIGSVFYQSVFSETLYKTDFIYYVMATGDPNFPKGSDVPVFDNSFPMDKIHLETVPYYKGTIS